VALLGELGITYGAMNAQTLMTEVDMVDAPLGGNRHRDATWWDRVAQEAHEYTPKISPGLWTFSKMDKFMLSVLDCPFRH